MWDETQLSGMKLEFLSSIAQTFDINLRLGYSAYKYSDVLMKIIICGQETVSLAKTGEELVLHEIGVGNIKLEQAWLEQFFSIS